MGRIRKDKNRTSASKIIFCISLCYLKRAVYEPCRKFLRLITAVGEGDNQLFQAAAMVMDQLAPVMAAD